MKDEEFGLDAAEEWINKRLRRQRIARTTRTVLIAVTMAMLGNLLAVGFERDDWHIIIVAGIAGLATLVAWLLTWGD